MKILTKQRNLYVFLKKSIKLFVLSNLFSTKDRGQKVLKELQQEHKNKKQQQHRYHKNQNVLTTHNILRFRIITEKGKRITDLSVEAHLKLKIWC